MKKRIESINRRAFLRNAATAGVASVLVSGPQALAGDACCPAEDKAACDQDTAQAKLPQVPRRVLGKTKVEVPILNLGGIFDIPNNQVLMQRAFDWGVTYWDTAHGYMNGNSEIGIGMYFEKHPQNRKKVFLVTKASGARSVDGFDERLATSFERMKTDYVDLYYYHGLADPDQLDDEMRAWAEKQKRDGKIRFFGFSTHKNMTETMAAAAKCPWIDVIMTKYNYRMRDDEAMQKALDACHKSGIGLVAMKTQGSGPIKPDGEAAEDLGAHFMQKGYTEHQARLQAVWQDERFATICSQMPNMAILVSNVAASLDKTSLDQADLAALDRHAAATRGEYCEGCGRCDVALGTAGCVSDVMRHLMYYRNYGQRDLARQLYAELDPAARQALRRADFARAEQRCPRRLPIGRLMAEAEQLLA